MDKQLIIEKVKQIGKQTLFYLTIGITLVVGVSIGYHYEKLKNFKQTSKFNPIVVKKSDVNLAIDEKNNMLIINKKDGTYTMYQDSIGYTIFNFYAKNIWSQHSKK
jgi:hypothetical protein